MPKATCCVEHKLSVGWLNAVILGGFAIAFSVFYFRG